MLWLIDALLLLLKHNGEDISLNITVKLEPVLLNSWVKFLRLTILCSCQIHAFVKKVSISGIYSLSFPVRAQTSSRLRYGL